MIRAFRYYMPICDRCGCAAGITDQDDLPPTREEAFDAALSLSWREIEGKLYCPDCLRYDADLDDFQPFPMEEGKF